MIEAEWLDYDTADEMADAVVDDVRATAAPIFPRKEVQER